MSEFKGIKRGLDWFDRFQAEASVVAQRVAASAGKAAGNKYEPKDALADWMFFVDRSWLCWMPEPESTGAPEIFLSYSKSTGGGKKVAGQTTLRTSAPPGDPQLAADPEEEPSALSASTPKKILKAKFEVFRIGPQLVVRADLKDELQAKYLGRIEIVAGELAAILILDVTA